MQILSLWSTGRVPFPWFIFPEPRSCCSSCQRLSQRKSPGGKVSGSREDSHIPPSSLEGLGEARAPRSTLAGNWGPCGGRRVKCGEGLEKLLSGMAVTELSLILGWDGMGCAGSSPEFPLPAPSRGPFPQLRQRRDLIPPPASPKSLGMGSRWSLGSPSAGASPQHRDELREHGPAPPALPGAHPKSRGKLPRMILSRSFLLAAFFFAFSFFLFYF